MSRAWILPLALLFVLAVSLYDAGDKRTALVIDTLGGGEFKAKIVELLSSHGYEVEYVEGAQATVGLFRRLKPRELYVLRVHSTEKQGQTWIITGEKYHPNKYPLLQLSGLVHKARTALNGDYYFAVSPSFIADCKGELDKGIVLMMGCQGLKTPTLAEAFLARNAEAYVSWNGNVCLSHTDRAFLELLQAYLEGCSLEESIERAMERIGRDPVYGSLLLKYPPTQLGADREVFLFEGLLLRR